MVLRQEVLPVDDREPQQAPHHAQGAAVVVVGAVVVGAIVVVGGAVVVVGAVDVVTNQLFP